MIGDLAVPRRAAWVLEGTGGRPTVRVEFEVRDGKPICTAVHVIASQTGRGVQTGDLSTLPNLASLTVATFEDLAVRVPKHDPLLGAAKDASPEDLVALINRAWFAAHDDLAAHTAGRRQIRQAPRAVELEVVADVYRRNIDGAPTEAVRVALGGVSRRTAARRIDEARTAGLLPRTTQGKRKA